MKVLVTGAGGQLGSALLAAAPREVTVTSATHAQFDIGDRAAVLTAVAELKPDLIINAAAYTAVDQAEREPELAFRINRDGAGNLAEAAHSTGARLFQVSTDYVFDGTKTTPYLPTDEPNPLNVYGASKLAGERLVAERTKGRALVVRTAWVYASVGRNFVNTMLRLMRERREVRVVADQFGSPTHATSLARALWTLAASPAQGVCHWTDAGACSWHEFAVAIRHEAGMLGLGLPHCAIVAIPSSEYPTPAARPAYGVLDKATAWQHTGPARHWQAELRECLAAHR